MILSPTFTYNLDTLISMLNLHKNYSKVDIESVYEFFNAEITYDHLPRHLRGITFRAPDLAGEVPDANVIINSDDHPFAQHSTKGHELIHVLKHATTNGALHFRCSINPRTRPEVEAEYGGAYLLVPLHSLKEGLSLGMPKEELAYCLEVTTDIIQRRFELAISSGDIRPKMIWT